ncbi:MAG TPA: VWA domain-containing protein [Pyrinomonadaceae bacterium]|jgi:VWFA-related protein|nr:VWA domain-containing protein [Pyrinomonadaceae bacterium]
MMMMQAKLSTLTCALALLLCGAFQSYAQESVADTLRVNTRVVFMDALVKDKKTGMPVSDLKQDNFEVYDEGQPRKLSYFTREGEARKPLALVLVLDLRDDGAGRFLRRADILNAISAELAKLPPEDEVALIALCEHDGNDNPLWLTRFTNDRAKVSSALNSIPAMMEQEQRLKEAREKETEASIATARKENSISININKGDKDKDKDKDKGDSATTKEPEIKPEEIASSTRYEGKNGAVVTRIVKKDGTVITKRENGNKEKIVEIENDLDLFSATSEVTDLAMNEKPNSRVSMVWVSDGLTPIFFEQREALEEMLMRSNVTFNAVTVEMKTTYKLLLPIAKPITNWVGMSISGSAQRFSKQTGGEVVRVHRPDDYAKGLNKIIGSLKARYSLGFTLAEQDQPDGRLHQLDVRVKARDEKGKDRKLIVSARKGYYAVKKDEKQTAAAK